MHDRQLIWLSLVAAGVITSTSAVAQTNDTNHSDTSAGQTYSAPSVHIDGINGNGVSSTTLYYPATGEIVGGGIDTPIRFGNFSGDASGTGFNRNLESVFDNASGNSSGTGFDNNGNSIDSNGNITNRPGAGNGVGAAGEDSNSVATDSTLGCATEACLKVDGSQPRVVTLNEVAEALDNSLGKSLDNLAAAENKAKLADSAPRRIARRSADNAGATRACINPVFEAREIVERQLIETEKFIEQVNEIEPQKSIW